MRRRTFIALMGGAVASPFAARAQANARVSRIGFLTPRSRPSPATHDAFSGAFLQGMTELGYTEGKKPYCRMALRGRKLHTPHGLRD